MTTSKPRWSVVIPLYNMCGTIGRTVASIVAQTEESWELIVVDDGSSDGSADLVGSFDDPRISLSNRRTQARERRETEASRLRRGRWSHSSTLMILGSGSSREPTRAGRRISGRRTVRNGLPTCVRAKLGQGRASPARPTSARAHTRLLPRLCGLRGLGLRFGSSIAQAHAAKRRMLPCRRSRWG